MTRMDSWDFFNFDFWPVRRKSKKIKIRLFSENHSKFDFCDFNFWNSKLKIATKTWKSYPGRIIGINMSERKILEFEEISRNSPYIFRDFSPSFQNGYFDKIFKNRVRTFGLHNRNSQKSRDSPYPSLIFMTHYNNFKATK